ncbi:MAG: hypothetical protein WD052_13865 [Bacteroidales bacterium]
MIFNNKKTGKTGNNYLIQPTVAQEQYLHVYAERRPFTDRWLLLTPVVDRFYRRLLPSAWNAAVKEVQNNRLSV